MEKWVVSAKRADFKEIAGRFKIDQVTARLIRNRDIVGESAIEEYLNGSLLNLHDPYLMKDMDRAVRILMEKIDEQKKIRVMGDYDADGIMATYILLRGLARCGGNVDYELPERIRDGFGLNKNLIDMAYDDGVDTILTCDNGIAALEETAYARNLGMTVVVTDHHEPKTEERNGIKYPLLPKVDALLNPHRPDCPYPYKNLCGAAIAYKLAAALYEAMGIPEEESWALIEYAGFATVTDVVELTGENRILVREGLLQLNNTENLGLRALIQRSKTRDSIMTSYHVGFVLGPCLNAGGRLETAKKSLELLLAQSEAEAAELAEELVMLNERRKAMTTEGYDQAVAQIEEKGMSKDRVLVIYLPTCHESLAGIIAGRLKERYYRPTFVLTDGEADVKGSGRSIPAYNMYEEMQKCDDLFLKYGGHPMAAGCSLKWENVDVLRERLNKLSTLTREELTKKIVIDVPMPIDYISEKLINELDYLEPFGTGNEKPLFAEKNLKVLHIRILGETKRAAGLKLKNPAGKVMDGIYFGDTGKLRTYLEEKFGETQADRCFHGLENNVELSIVYYPRIHEWSGNRTIQVVVQHYR